VGVKCRREKEKREKLDSVEASERNTRVFRSGIHARPRYRELSIVPR